MLGLRSLLVVALVGFAGAQEPAKAPAKVYLGLSPAEADGVIQDLAGGIPFLKKDFSLGKLYRGLKAKGPSEDAEPLLPEEFLALPEEGRGGALHPDTAILLVLRVWRAAAWARPEESGTQDWMEPVLIRAQPVGAPKAAGIRGSGYALGGNAGVLGSGTGKQLGPSWPLLEFRRNLPGSDPRVGLDQGSRLVEPDRAARNWSLQNSGGVFTFAPELYFATDAAAKAELEDWVLARILVARAEGAWDGPVLRGRFLKLAAPRVPAWDEALAARLKRAAEALAPAAPAVPPAPGR